jgi:hypothetical protein
MESKDIATRMLKELETERAHRIIVINQIQNFYDSLSSQGFGPLDSLSVLISNWKIGLTALETEIETWGATIANL